MSKNQWKRGNIMPFLDWIGKNKVINHHNDVPFRVLERQYSYDESGQHTEDNGSKNMIIQGDNLEALKSLLPRYENKIKCIYIDPPYNTGNENWIYNDNVNDPKIQKWLGKVVGPESKDLTRHDKWLCMMYPRLKLLQKLLSDDGVIFISIDDNEQANLKLVCDEIFGNRNFIADFIWNSRKSVSNDAVVSLSHNYILCYSKNTEIFYENKSKFKFSDVGEGFENPDNDPRGAWKADPFDSPGIRPNLTYVITNPNTGAEYLPPSGRCWRTGEKEYLEFLKDNRIVFGKTGNSKPQLKRFLNEAKSKGLTPKSLWDGCGTTTDGTKEIINIFGTKIFDTPKPTNLIKNILELSTDENSIILDSFAGSGTTAHAVLNMNKADGGNRRFILIEMLDYADSITAERVKRVINGYGDGKKKVDGTGGNFSFYKLGEPIIEDDKINENLPIDIIREYIWFTETRTEYNKLSDSDNGYFLGEFQGTDYYLYYEKDSLTTLNYDFCSKIDRVSSEYIIYADVCTLSEKELMKYNITFKKIPRDVTRF